MATITIRNLDEKIKRKLQVRAAQNGRSMETEARELLTAGVTSQEEGAPAKEDLFTAIRKHVAKFGGVDLEIPPREFSNRPIPTFD